MRSREEGGSWGKHGFSHAKRRPGRCNRASNVLDAPRLGRFAFPGNVGHDLLAESHTVTT